MRAARTSGRVTHPIFSGYYTDGNISTDHMTSLRMMSPTSRPQHSCRRCGAASSWASMHCDPALSRMTSARPAVAHTEVDGLHQGPGQIVGELAALHGIGLHHGVQEVKILRTQSPQNSPHSPGTVAAAPRTPVPAHRQIVRIKFHQSREVGKTRREEGGDTLRALHVRRHHDPRKKFDD